MAMNIAQVVAEKLTDGSKVFSVKVPNADGGSVILACIDERSANDVAIALRRGVIDVCTKE